MKTLRRNKELPPRLSSYRQVKPDASRRKTRVGLKMTSAEYMTLKNNAASAQLTIIDYIVRQCCGGTR